MPESAFPVDPAANQNPLRQLIGRRLGKYHITHMLGRGGMGVVYAAEDTLLRRLVAIKLLPESIERNATAVERFFREAQAAARLNHPNVISIYDIGQAEGSFFIVMELLKPLSAAGYLRQSGPMHWVEATRVIADCCAGIHAAHQLGLIHRDLKPDDKDRSISHLRNGV